MRRADLAVFKQVIAGNITPDYEGSAMIRFAVLGLLAVTSCVLAPASFGHPGGLAADGCHNDRKNGGRHCHRAPAFQAPAFPQHSPRGSTYYPNCAAARAAGAAPLYRGELGYGTHLDRDNDGKACE